MEAASQYRFVLGLLSEGRERWQDVDEDDKGSTFRFTFERKVKMHLLGTSKLSLALSLRAALTCSSATPADTLVDGHFRSSTSDEQARFPLIEVQGLAEDLMDDCNSEKAPSDPVSTFAFQVRPRRRSARLLSSPQLTPPRCARQVQPIVSAGKAFAYALRTRAALPENRIEFAVGHWIDCGLSKAAAKMCAPSLLPRLLDLSLSVS